jgi:hypothetical protein
MMVNVRSGGCKASHLLPRHLELIPHVRVRVRALADTRRPFPTSIGVLPSSKRLAPTDTTFLEKNHDLHNMIPRLARASIHSSKALAGSPCTLKVFQRHQSTLPQAATSPQPPQTHQASSPQIARHPSSTSHPALGDEEPERNNDNGIFLIFGGLLLAGAPLSYWYWGYRERAMKQKKEEMLRGIQERYAARHATD